MYVYIYMHIRTINEKRGHNLKKKTKKGIWERLKGRKKLYK